MSEDIVENTEQLSVENRLEFSQLEGLSYERLPQKLLLNQPGFMTTLRVISNRTQQEKAAKGEGREWSCFQVKAPNGGLDYIGMEPGDEAHGQDINKVEDWTGYHPSDVKLILQMSKDNQWQLKHILMRESVAEEDIPEQLRGIIKTEREVNALIHSHAGDDTFSPTDFSMVVEQLARPDGRVMIPNSVVVTAHKVYMLHVPTDGVVQTFRGQLDKVMAGVKGMLANDDFIAHQEMSDANILEYIKAQARKHKIGFYAGNLDSPELERVA